MNDELYININNLICPICCEIFNNPFNCKNCEKTICENCLKKIRNSRIDSGNTLYCPFCNEKDDYYKNEEILKLLSKKNCFCIKCQQKFSYTEEFEEHNKICNLKCKICNKLFNKLKNFLNHIKEEHLDDVFKKMAKNKELNNDNIEKDYLKDNINNLNNYQNYLDEINKKIKTNINIQYCNKPNNIKCNCCEKKICMTKNCMCKDCMKLNKKNLGLEKYYLINKFGRVCKINYMNNNFECFCNCDDIQEKLINNNIHYIPIKCGKETIIDCKKYCKGCEILKNLIENYLTKDELDYLKKNNNN